MSLCLGRRALRVYVATVALATIMLLGDIALARADTLPDGRAYEFVTPNLGGAAILQDGIAATEATASGNALAFTAHDTTSTAPASLYYNLIVANRGAEGWAVSPLAPPLPVPEPGLIATGLQESLSDDLTQTVFATTQPLTATAQTGSNLFLRDSAGQFDLLTPVSTGAGPLFAVQPAFYAASDDYSHFYYAPQVAQKAQDPVGAGNLYQWAGGRTSLVNILPNGQPGPDPAVLGGRALNASNDQITTLPAMSSNGSEVLFQEDGLAQSPLYLRANSSQTTDVGATQRTTPDPNASGNPDPVGITGDGSQVLFTSATELTDDANTGTNDTGNDLYDYDVASGTLTDLTVDTHHSDADGADVRKIVAVDPGASYVYFVAEGRLGQVAGPQAGAQNLYVEHDGVTTFIARVPGLVSGAYVTPDGAHLAFATTDSLTGYDNTDRATGLPDAEVFEYAAATGSLQCESCRPSGAPPTAAATLPLNNGTYHPRVLSDDGSRAFFESADAVVPGATNGLENVYEYEGGQVSLISAGDGPSAAYFADASSSGNDVFFESYDDLDGLNPSLQSGIYDARVGGGFPATAAAAECSDPTGCRGATPAAAAPPTIRTTAVRPVDQVLHRPRLTNHKLIRGSAVMFTLKVPVAGKLQTTGHQIRRAQRSVRHRGTYRLKVALTKSARGRLAHRHRLTLAIHVRYAPTSGTASTTTFHLTIKGGHR